LRSRLSRISARDDLGQIGLEEGRALGADHLAQIDGIDLGLIGDAGVEVAPHVGGPVKRDRPEGQLLSHDLTARSWF
jgi:hypothetical protein